MNGLDVDYVVDHLLSLEDLDNFDLINKLSDLWEVYNESWYKFNKFLLPNFWKVMNDIEKLDSFDKTCKKIIEAWYDDIEDIFYSDDDFENLKLNYGFKGNDIFETKESVRKSLKEGINDELIATSSDGETTLYLSDERQANHGKDPHYEFKLGENGYFTRYIRCDDNRCENVVLDWIKEFDFNISKSEISKIIKLHESKKSTKKMRKSMKESKDKFIIWSNEGYLDFEGDPSDNISADECYMIFNTEKEAEEYINELKKEYDNEWRDSLEIQAMY